jgi:8-oxo-dGTP diphosphatase
MPNTRTSKDVVFREPLTVTSVLSGDVTGITQDRVRVIVDVNLLVIRNESLLLGRRSNTGFADGLYGLPAGHLDLGESVIVAAIREAREELGISISAKDARFVQVMHNSYGIGRLALFFEVRNWSGRIVNAEPTKCDDLRWFPLSCLPDNTVPHIKAAIHHYTQGTMLSLYGW